MSQHTIWRNISRACVFSQAKGDWKYKHESEMSSPYCMTCVYCTMNIFSNSKLVCFKASSFRGNSATHLKIQLSRTIHGRVGVFNGNTLNSHVMRKSQGNYPMYNKCIFHNRISASSDEPSWGVHWVFLCSCNAASSSRWHGQCWAEWGGAWGWCWGWSSPVPDTAHSGER